ncbi:MAG TPA: class I SAM-dependent methyltransferase [Gammaproteobacteria bacterium]|nr:class I SAM-dependent methyltransferase [Gammaproteobacteria bacterium]
MRRAVHHQTMTTDYAHMPPDPDTHKQQVTSLFDLIAEGYDNPSQRFFGRCADRLVECLRPTRGSEVLDIATGTGVAAIALAGAVGAEGRVQAIDLSPAMLDRAATNIQALSLPNIDLHIMDAERLDFDSAHFDHVSCAFGLFFIPDMGEALRQWLRVLKPGGTLAFTSFADRAFRPLAEMFIEDLEAFGLTPPAPGWYRLSDPTVVRQLLEAAGFEAIETAEEQHGHYLADTSGWWELLWNSGFRGYLNALAPEQLAAFRRMHLARVAERATEQGLWLDIATLFTTARRPAGSA